MVFLKFGFSKLLAFSRITVDRLTRGQDKWLSELHDTDTRRLVLWQVHIGTDRVFNVSVGVELVVDRNLFIRS